VSIEHVRNHPNQPFDQKFDRLQPKFGSAQLGSVTVTGVHQEVDKKVSGGFSTSKTLKNIGKPWKLEYLET